VLAWGGTRASPARAGEQHATIWYSGGLVGIERWDGRSTGADMPVDEKRTKSGTAKKGFRGGKRCAGG